MEAWIYRGISFPLKLYRFTRDLNRSIRQFFVSITFWIFNIKSPTYSENCSRICFCSTNQCTEMLIIKVEEYIFIKHKKLLNFHSNNLLHLQSSVFCIVLYYGIAEMHVAVKRAYSKYLLREKTYNYIIKQMTISAKYTQDVFIIATKKAELTYCIKRQRSIKANHSSTSKNCRIFLRVIGDIYSSRL